jgi:hypothetical protein
MEGESIATLYGLVDPEGVLYTPPPILAGIWLFQQV